MATSQTLQTQLLEHQLFSALKAQIIGLATALYGTRSTCPPTVFDVLSFATPNHTGDGASAPTSSMYDANGILIADDEAEPKLGVSLIQYTGPPTSPFIAWEMVSYVDDETSRVGGAEKLLEDLGKGVGGLVGMLIEKGDWHVKHLRIPDLKAASGEEDEEEEASEEWEGDQDEGGEEHKDGIADGGERGGRRGWWSPTLEPIEEEI